MSSGREKLNLKTPASSTWQESESRTRAMNNPPETADNEFMMYTFKIQPCPVWPRPHAWHRCPYVHPGERARRRDPKIVPYSSVRCRNYKGNKCTYGDKCGFSHGDFETLAHPARYKTKRCNLKPRCNRLFCFFAHSDEEQRRAVRSHHPTTSTVALRPGGGISQPSMAWPQQNVPFPRIHPQMSHPRSSVNPRDLRFDGFQVQPQPHMNRLPCFSANRNENSSAQVLGRHPTLLQSTDRLAPPTNRPSSSARNWSAGVLDWSIRPEEPARSWISLFKGNHN